MNQYTKAFAAFLTSAVGLAALLGFNPGFASAENVAAASAIVGTITAAVYQLRNG